MLNIPVLLVNRLSGDLLRRDSFGLLVEMDVSASLSMRLSRNVVAKPKQQGPEVARRPIVIGAHWGTVCAVPSNPSRQ